MHELQTFRSISVLVECVGSGICCIKSWDINNITQSSFPSLIQAAGRRDDVHYVLHFSAHCENTLAATASGLAEGANAIEIDLRKVSSGRPAFARMQD